MLLSPLVVLVLLETGLRWGGYGYPTRFFLKAGGGDYYTPNDCYAWQFWLHKPSARPDFFRLPASKPRGTLRVFVLGESAAMGTPDPAFSFQRILTVILERRHPGIRFEFVNTAMRGINSHVVRPIAEECAHFQPDLYLVYMGNNEAVGLHAPDPDVPAWTQNLTFIRARQALQSSRLGQLLTSALVRGSERKETQDAEYFRRHRLAADDPRRLRLGEHFRANLAAICRAGTKAGAKVVLCTVPGNLQDCPPLASLHRADLTASTQADWAAAYARGVAAETAGRRAEAIGNYRQALSLDDHFAELHFRLARSLLAGGDVPAARAEFALARDWDALQFRTDRRLNAFIRETAADLAGVGVNLVDAERALAEADTGEQGIPGRRFFNDHVHPTFDGDYALALAIYPAIEAVLGNRLGPPAGTAAPSRQECADALAFTAWDEINVRAAMVDLTTRPPFTGQLDHAERQALAEQTLHAAEAALAPPTVQRALEVYRRAVTQRPQDWKLQFNLGMLLRELGQPAAAATEFASLVGAYPEAPRFREWQEHARAGARSPRNRAGPPGRQP